MVSAGYRNRHCRSGGSGFRDRRVGDATLSRCNHAHGSHGSLGYRPNGFDIETGSVNTGSSVSYTIVIEAQAQNQKALIQIGSVSAGTGTTSIPQNKKNTTFTGTLPTTPGAHALQVVLGGFRYTE